MKEGGPALKVKTVRPKAEGERWSAIAIKDIVATPDMPNPKDDSQKDPRSERNTRGLDSGTGTSESTTVSWKSTARRLDVKDARTK